VAALLALHFFSFPFRELPLVTDVRHYVHFAWRVAEGALPHRDYFDLKPPLATVAGAALLRARRAWDGDGLLAVRTGYLALAVLAGVLSFRIQARLAGGRVLPALAALAPYAGFSLLGALPAVGNVPKLLMALLASLAALLAQRGLWLPAGVAATLAALDWQVGALALLGVVLAAGLSGASRARALAQVAAGAVLVLGPLAVGYLALSGAGELLGQTVMAAFFRGEASWRARGLAEEVVRRARLVAAGCPGEAWLLALSAAGLGAWARRVVRERPLRPLEVSLTVYHAGVVAFSLLDFQGHGDLFLLLHSAAFFAGFVLARLAALPRPWARWAALALGLLAVRPWAPRGAEALAGPTAGGRISLADQRAVATRLRAAVLPGRTPLFLGASEQAFLAQVPSAGPLVVWTPATQRYYRLAPEETAGQTLARLVRASGATLLVCDRGSPLLPPGAGFSFLGQEAAGPSYAVDVLEVPPVR
jgi:hypothetical protein